jgi:hypothetical protein
MDEIRVQRTDTTSKLQSTMMMRGELAEGLSIDNKVRVLGMTGDFLFTCDHENEIKIFGSQSFG